MSTGVLARAIVVALVVIPAAPALARSKLRIADPGRFTARVVACNASNQDACGGMLELNGQEYGYDGGALTGSVGTSGRLAHGRASFGSASTDPAVQGPFQLTFQPVASGGASGGFIGSGSPLGLAGANGLYFEFQVALYIQVSGGEPVAAAGPSPGAGVGGGCVIGTAAAPLEADFLPTLTGFFGNRGAVAYDQARGTASLTATRLSFPGAQNCQGQESVVDQQLGIPGPGSISVNLKFGPVIVSSAYRAAHPPRHRRRTSKH